MSIRQRQREMQTDNQTNRHTYVEQEKRGRQEKKELPLIFEDDTIQENVP